MDYQKSFYAILILNLLLLTLLGAISLRFLSGQMRKTQEVDPEIMAQYEVTLEVDQFLSLVEQLKEKE